MAPTEQAVYKRTEVAPGEQLAEGAPVLVIAPLVLAGLALNHSVLQQTILDVRVALRVVRHQLEPRGDLFERVVGPSWANRRDPWRRVVHLLAGRVNARVAEDDSSYAARV